nr:unnamed protein product [Haemonchus contortus]
MDWGVLLVSGGVFGFFLLSGISLSISLYIIHSRALGRKQAKYLTPYIFNKLFRIVVLGTLAIVILVSPQLIKTYFYASVYAMFECIAGIVALEKFRSGDGSMEDEERAGRPSLVDQDVLLRVVEEYRRQPLREIAKMMGVSHTVVAAHLKQLGVVKKLDKGFKFAVEPFLHRVVTCDEKWILYDNRKRSAQWPYEVGVYSRGLDALR